MLQLQQKPTCHPRNCLSTLNMASHTNQYLADWTWQQRQSWHFMKPPGANPNFRSAHSPFAFLLLTWSFAPRFPGCRSEPQWLHEWSLPPAWQSVPLTPIDAPRNNKRHCKFTSVLLTLTPECQIFACYLSQAFGTYYFDSTKDFTISIVQF